MKIQKKSLIIFIAVTIAVTLITMMMISNYSPLDIQEFRSSVFGGIWGFFIFPAMLLFIFPLMFIFGNIICNIVPNQCFGLIDGGPLDPYFFTTLSILIGVLYGLLTFPVIKLYKKIKTKIQTK